MGHRATGFHTYRTFHNYADPVIATDPFELKNRFGDMMGYFDLFHFHFNKSILPGFGDLELLEREGKPTVMHHWGNDVRRGSIASRSNPYVFTGDSQKEEEIHKKLLRVGERVTTAIVQDYEVYASVQPYYRNVRILPLAIDVSRFNPAYPDATEKKPLVVHAPTNPAFKGTKIIEEAIDKLRRELPLRYTRIERKSHRDAIALYRQADIVIDQILCGSYGLLSVEAMALGKPVVVYVRDDLVSTFPGGGVPVCNANPDSLYDRLKALLQDGSLRHQLGKQGRDYVERHHDIRLVGRKLLDIYQGLSPRS